MGPVALELLGEPSKKTADEYRFGTHGSLSVDLKKGVWHDHEANVGGGVIDLVISRRSTDKAGAITWLRERKHIEPPSSKGAFNIVATYDYTDADGVLLFQVCRMEPKDFRQRRPDPERPREWLWKLGPVERVLYHLPEVIAAVRAGQPVYIVEGEKAADALRALGFTATCSPGGAKKWRREFASYFSGAKVVLLPDNDEAGREHRDMVFRSITRMRASIATIYLPGLPDKGDAYDWIAAGGTATDLKTLLAEAVEGTADKEDEPPPFSDEDFAGIDIDEADDRPALSAAEWSDPVDFFESAESAGVPVLEAKHLPEALWPFVSDTATRMGVDPAGVALSALVACTAMISDNWAVQPKRFDNLWTENARIWGAIVGDPSILKTPVISACTRPIDKLEAEARKRHSDEMRVWRVAEAAAKAAKEAFPPQPKLDRYMVEGTTPEALSEVLRDDDEAKMRAPCRKVLSRHDEMSEFFGGLDRYKAGGKGGGERGAYLRLYNGGRYTIDRIGRGSFAVPNWSACFLGGVQPGPIQRIASDAADDGLLQRFLYVVPDRQLRGVDRKPDQEAMDRYAALFPVLIAFQPATPIGGDHFGPVVFHEDAHAHREDIDALANAMAAMPDTSPRLKAAFGKWPGLFARLCLTFHMIALADHRARQQQLPVMQVISEKTASQVAAFIRDILLPHLLRAEAVMFSTAQTSHARWIAGFLLSKKLERVAVRDICMSYRPFRAPEARREMDAVMASLAAIGWIEPDEPGNLARGITSWKVNPAIHTRFEARAKVEVERRAAARD